MATISKGSMMFDAHDISQPAERFSLVGICLDTQAGVELRKLIRGNHSLRLQGEVHTYLTEDDNGLSWMQPPGPDICLIDFDADRSSAIATAECIQKKLPGTVIFAISANPQPNLIIEAMRCGCSEYLVKPASPDQLLEAVTRVGGRRREKPEISTGALLAFFGGKGGSGVTTVATHLGTLLARSFGRKTVLIDLHPTCGEASLFLGHTKPQYNFYELADSVDRLDTDLLQSYVLQHPSGMELLPGPEFCEVDRHIRPESITQTIDYIRTKYDFVLVDCAPGLTEQNLEVFRRSDHVYIVTVPEVPAIRNVARLLDYFNRHEIAQNKLEVVVNRHHKKNSVINDYQIETAIRRKIFWKIPNQYHKVIHTINAGDPSAQLSNSDVAQSFLAWAESLGGNQADPPAIKKSGKSLLGLFRR